MCAHCQAEVQVPEGEGLLQLSGVYSVAPVLIYCLKPLQGCHKVGVNNKGLGGVWKEMHARRCWNAAFEGHETTVASVPSSIGHPP